MLFKYGCRCVFAVFKFLCVVEMVMSSAFVIRIRIIRIRIRNVYF